MLQIGIGAEGESLLPTAAGIEFDQVARDVLDALLRLLLQSVPGRGGSPVSPLRYLLIL